MGDSRNDAERTENTRGDIGNRCASFDCRPARPFAREAHDATHGLCHEVETRPIGVGTSPPITGNRTPDEVGEALPELFIAKPEPFQGAAAVILDEYIGLLE